MTGAGPDGEGDTRPGAAIVTSSAIGTGLFAVSSVAAVFADGARPVAAGIALALFAVGTVAFLWAYAIAIGRSRTDAIGIGGLYFLAGDTAPRRAKVPLLVSFAAQVALALATASARPFTSLAFGILVPVYGLGLAGLWGARFGRFRPRPQPAAR
ncbi:MAG TPA: hypothetical protein VF230_07250 [Acidimicrobiales bacterium]